MTTYFKQSIISFVLLIFTFQLSGIALGASNVKQTPADLTSSSLPEDSKQNEDESLYIVVLKDPRSVRQKGLAGGVGYRLKSNYNRDPILKKLARNITKDFKLELLEQWPIESINVHCLVIKLNEQQKHLIAQLENDARVLWVQKYHFFQAASKPEVRFEPNTNQKSLNLPNLQKGLTGKGIRLAIVDSSVDSQHKDLQHAVKSKMNFVAKNKGLLAGEEHGTGMAGIIAGWPSSKLGYRGIAPGVGLYVYRGCWEEDEKTRCSTLTLSRALDAIAKDPPDILNLSLTGPKDRLLERIVDEITQKDVVIVTAYDRKRPAGKRFPLYRPEVFVAKIANPDELRESNIFPLPGQQILTSQPQQAHAYMSGDSLSAASLSAVIALMKQISPDLKHASIKEHLLKALGDKKTADSLSVCKLLDQLESNLGC